MVNQGNSYLLKLTKDVSFLNKANLRSKLQTIPDNSEVVIDGSQAHFIDSDIRETIEDFIKASRAKNIAVDVKKISI